jgi:hypothetical protein
MKGSSATPGTGLPGRFGVDYAFINTATIDIYVDQNKVRHSTRTEYHKYNSGLLKKRSTFSESLSSWSVCVPLLLGLDQHSTRLFVVLLPPQSNPY